MIFKVAGLDLATPLLLSLGVVSLVMLFVCPAGAALGYLQVRKSYTGKSFVDVLVLLPLLLPPSVVGYYLLLIFGRAGPIGALLERFFGVRLVFSFWGAVIASSVVAFPMMVKGAEAAFARVDKELEEAGTIDGLSRFGVLRHITLPLSQRGLISAAVLTMGRALGEFGATLMFAGNIPGKTNTLPLEIYQALQTNDDKRATALALLLTSISGGLAFWLTRLRDKAPLV